MNPKIAAVVHNTNLTYHYLQISSIIPKNDHDANNIGFKLGQAKDLVKKLINAHNI